MKVWFLLAQAEYVAYTFVKPCFKTFLYTLGGLNLWVEINQKLSKLLWVNLGDQSNVVKKDGKWLSKAMLEQGKLNFSFKNFQLIHARQLGRDSRLKTEMVSFHFPAALQTTYPGTWK